MFFTAGHSPVSLEILSSGKYSQLNGAGGFGPKLFTKVPLVAERTGSSLCLGQIDQGQGRLGDQEERQDDLLRTLPTKCPKGGFPVKAEVTFAENGDETKPITVPVMAKTPCPRH